MTILKIIVGLLVITNVYQAWLISQLDDRVDNLSAYYRSLEEYAFKIGDKLAAIEYKKEGGI